MNADKSETKQTENTNEKLPWQSIPRWALPILIILTGVVIFFIAQYAASFLMSLYASIRGWDYQQANSWLTNSVTAQFFFVLFFETIVIGLLYGIFKHYHRSLATIGLKRPRLVDGAYGLVAYPVYLIIYLAVLAISIHFFPSLNVNQSQNIGFNSVHGTYQLVLTFFSLVILPPIAEELLFRGFLFEGLKKSMPVIYAAIITSVIFAAAHLPEGSSGPFWVGALDVFTLSLVLVYLKQKTKTLWPGIVLHALKNMVAFVSLFLLTNR